MVYFVHPFELAQQQPELGTQMGRWGQVGQTGFCTFVGHVGAAVSSVVGVAIFGVQNENARDTMANDSPLRRTGRSCEHQTLD